MSYKTLDQIKVKVEEVWRVEQFINLSEEEKEKYWELYNKAEPVGASFFCVDDVLYRPFKQYVIADFDCNDFDHEYYTMSIYKIEKKYLIATFNNIQVVRKEDFKHLLFNHAQTYGNLEFSF